MYSYVPEMKRKSDWMELNNAIQTEKFKMTALFLKPSI